MKADNYPAIEQDTLYRGPGIVVTNDEVRLKTHSYPLSSVHSVSVRKSMNRESALIIGGAGGVLLLVALTMLYLGFWGLGLITQFIAVLLCGVAAFSKSYLLTLKTIDEEQFTVWLDDRDEAYRAMNFIVLAKTTPHSEA